MTFRAPSLPTYFISLIIASVVGGLAWLALGDTGNALLLLVAGVLIGHFSGSFFSDNEASQTPSNTRGSTNSKPSSLKPSPHTPVVTPAAKPNDGEIKSIYVGNVAFSAPREALQDLFAAHGKVVSVRLMTDRVTRRPRGYGFVEMESEAALAAIAALDGSEFFERTLRVNEAKQRSPHRED